MLKKSIIKVVTIAFLLSFQNKLQTNITTMQHWDPSPIFSSNNSSMPQSSHIHHLRKSNEREGRNGASNINFTASVQGAVKATGPTGCKTYNLNCEEGSPAENQLGDFRGTPYAMGLFLGSDPEGRTLWENPAGTDIKNDGNVDHLKAPINTSLPKNLQSVIEGLGKPTNANKSLMFSPTSITATVPSVFYDKKLAEDKTYFGAFSLPIDYRKYSFRMEMNVELFKDLNCTIQGGVANINQKTSGLQSLSKTTTLYKELSYRNPNDTQNNVLPTVPLPKAQNDFDQYVSDNINSLLDSENGINQSAANFNKISMEDMRGIVTFKKNIYSEKAGKITGENKEIIITPYIYGGGSIPSGASKDYDQLLSLYFGNNGHISAGVGTGILFDLIDSIEIGAEIGGTFFFSKSEIRPMPTHELQRVLFPYRANVTTSPGANWHFNLNLNSFRFMKYVSFWATYEFIEHTKDKYSICQNNIAKNGEKIFLPEVLEKISDWRSQMFNVGLIFELNPSMMASLALQKNLSCRNAYQPIGIHGSINFNF